MTSGTIRSSSRSICAPGELHATAEFAQRGADRVAGGVAGAGPQRRDRLGQRSSALPGEPGPQLVRAGQDQCAGLVDGLGPLAAGAAPVGHQRADRLYRPVAALGHPRGPAGLRGAGRADRVQRVGLAVAVPVLPAAPGCLHHPHAASREIPGQASAVAARPLHAHQRDVPELAQPAGQAGVAGPGRGELPRPEQPADRVKRRGDVHLKVSVHPAGNGTRVFYDGHCRPFLS